MQYRLKAGSELPEGLTLSNTGIISGTLMRAYTGHKFTVVAYADMAQPKEVTYSMTVHGIVMEDFVAENVILGKSFSAKLSAAVNDGSNTVYIRLKDGQELPSGMQLLADGTLYGTPDEVGKMSFVVEASADGYQTVEATVTVDVVELYAEDPEGEAVPPLEDRIAEGSGCGSSIDAGTMSVVGAALIVAAVSVIRLKKKNHSENL